MRNSTIKDIYVDNELEMALQEESKRRFLFNLEENFCSYLIDENSKRRNY
jgi:hypothetical protein